MTITNKTHSTQKIKSGKKKTTKNASLVKKQKKHMTKKTSSLLNLHFIFGPHSLNFDVDQE